MVLIELILYRFIFEYFAKVNLTFQTCTILVDLMERVFAYLSTCE